MKNFKTIVCIFLLLFTSTLIVCMDEHTAEADTPKDDNNFWITPPTKPGAIYSAPYMNVPRFWRTFLHNANWSMMYSLNGVAWDDCTSYLQVGLVNRSGGDGKKVSLNFTAPYTAYYMLNISIGYPVVSYSFDTVLKEFTIVFGGTQYQFTWQLNYSDIKSLPNLVFNYGVRNNFFWFSIRRTTLISAGFHISLDPIYTVTSRTFGQATALSTQRKLTRDINGTLYETYAKRNGTGLYSNIMVAHSHDNGVTWSNVNVTNEPGTSTYYQNWSSIAVDSRGWVHVVWMGKTSGSGTGTWIRYCHSVTNGDTWESIINITITINVAAAYPSMAINSSNGIWVVFQGKGSASNPNINQEWVSKSSDGSNWAARINLMDLSYAQNYGSIVVNSSDGVMVCWTGRHRGSTTNYQVRWTKFTTGNLYDFLKPANITTDTLVTRNEWLSLAINDSDGVYCCWKQGVLSNSVFYSRTTNWGTWVTPVGISSGTGVQYEPSVSINASAGVVFAWHGKMNASSTYTNIRCKKYNSLTQQMSTIIFNLTNNKTRNQVSVNLLSGYWPYKYLARPARPKTGYCYVWVDTTGTIFYNESADLSWDPNLNTPPTITIVYALNGASQIPLSPQFWVWVNDTDTAALAVCWRENSSGSWVTRQLNSSFTQGTRCYWTNTYATTNYKLYYWKVFAFDGTTNVTTGNLSFRTMWLFPITISSVYPVNGSISIPCQSSVHAKFTHSTGYDLNITWYQVKPIGTQYYMSSNLDVGCNKTYYSSFSNATWLSTVYNWTVNVSDGHGNSTFFGYYNFTTVSNNVTPTPLTLYENIVNATGTHEYELTGSGYHVWANYTGDTTPFAYHNNTHNVSGLKSLKLFSNGYHLYDNQSGNVTPIHRFENIINATGTHDYVLNGTGYWDWANYTGYNALNFIENLKNATGTHSSFWTGTQWNIYNNYTGLNGINLFENIVNAVGTHQKLWDGSAWNVWANYTGNAPPGTGNLNIINPNPGNGTHSTNYLRKDDSGLTTSVDVSYVNFTTPPAVSPGDYTVSVAGSVISNGPNIQNDSAVYANAWGNASGQPVTGPLSIGQWESAGVYWIVRGFLYFNTSSIPDEAVIDSGYVALVVYEDDYTDVDFNVSVQQCKPPAFHVPLVSGDYNKANFPPVAVYGTKNTTGYSDDQWFNISLTANGIADVNVSGYTKCVLRSYPDIAGIDPDIGVDEWIQFYAPGGVTPLFGPHLIINYTIPSSNWAHIVNLTWRSNSSGAWLPYDYSFIVSNGTVTVPALNFSDVGTYWWNLSWDSNHTNFGNSSVFGFETVVAGGGGVTFISGGGTGSMIVMSSPLLIIGGVLGLLFMSRRTRKQKGINRNKQ